jgi:hypothetical protein
LREHSVGPPWHLTLTRVGVLEPPALVLRLPPPS